MPGSNRCVSVLPFNPLRHQRGSSLLEVLVAVLVMAIGVLGAAALQLQALRYGAGAVHTTHASFIAYDMLDRIRANADGLADYLVEIEGDCTRAGEGAADIARRDLLDFFEAVTCHLPSGKGRIFLSDNLVSVAINWSESRIRADDAETEFVVSSLIRAL